MISVLAGNWKMNGSKKDLDTWFKDFFEKAVDFEKNNLIKEIPTILICVPSIYIDYALKLADEYNKKTSKLKVFVGGQDCHYEDKGAFTGNISPLFLNEFGCEFVITGHSERREYEQETNEIVAKKSVNAIKNSLTPLICVGESLETREAKKHLEFIEKQVIESVKDVDLNKAIIAYEPVWAIGTGKVPSLDDIEEINSHIKSVIAKEFGIKNIKVLYGGSVKSSNIDGISKLKSVDGVLVGGASLKGEEFFNIYKNSL